MSRLSNESLENYCIAGMRWKFGLEIESIKTTKKSAAKTLEPHAFRLSPFALHGGSFGAFYCWQLIIDSKL